jgi:exonuclease III
MACRKKIDFLTRHLDPDVMLIQECEEPGGLSDFKANYNYVWVGDNRKKGLAICVKKQHEFKEMELDHSQVKYFVGIELDDMKIIGFWAMNDVQDPRKRYIAQVWRGLKQLDGMLGNNTIIAGDFNWNTYWDTHLSYPLYGNFKDVIELCSNKGIYSAYHFVNKEPFGKEQQSTFYMHRKRTIPYHTDFIFASRELLDRSKELNIGQYETWVELSDHMPLLFDYWQSSFKIAPTYSSKTTERRVRST